jgi:hypothetical protein
VSRQIRSSEQRADAGETVEDDGDRLVGMDAKVVRAVVADDQLAGDEVLALLDAHRLRHRLGPENGLDDEQGEGDQRQDDDEPCVCERQVPREWSSQLSLFSSISCAQLDIETLPTRVTPLLSFLHRRDESARAACHLA